MYKIIHVFLLTHLFGGFLNAQDASEFFPYHKGDIWEYAVEGFGIEDHVKVVAVGDTVLFNGKRYAHFRGPIDEFYRIDDSLRVYQYVPPPLGRCPDSEFVAYDLRMTGQGIWSTCLRSYDGDTLCNYVGLFFEQQNVWYADLNVAADTRMFCEVQLMPSGDTVFCPLVQRTSYIPRRLAKGIGLVWKQYEGPAVKLVGAIIDSVQYGHITGTDQPLQAEVANRKAVDVLSCYPNPFNSPVSVSFSLTKNRLLGCSILDILGRQVRSLEPQILSSEVYQLTWDGKSDHGNQLSSGVYYLIIRSDVGSSALALLLLQ